MALTRATPKRMLSRPVLCSWLSLCSQLSLHLVYNTGLEQYDRQVCSNCHQVTGASQVGHVTNGCNKATAKVNEHCKIGTWSVNTLYHPGKSGNVKRETNRLQYVLVRRGEHGMAIFHLLYGSSSTHGRGESHEGGVGMLMKRKCMDAMIRF
ncbi:hypothetical protein E2C01_095426 [Portunus trituberculatus]|uniref:Uncharacterized protein n=1 Tax=Portunus trituberculatus TaxID=210409 RepID=A0A5B7JYP2_PORTR|nr:hypothetical protein [Portunus trituberculatus]